MKNIYLLGAVCLLAGCAQTAHRPPDEGPHATLAFTGRIEAILSATTPGPGTYRPGMGGAIGGAAVGAFQALRIGERFTYSIITNEGVSQSVMTSEELKVGDCVDAFVSKNKINQPNWTYGEISLRPSSACKDFAN